MKFFGKQTVLADLRLHKLNAGLVRSGSLRSLSGTVTTWANIGNWPITESTGMGDGAAQQNVTITLWRVGEAVAPRADYTITCEGKTLNIVSVTPRLNEDESANYAIYECQCTRKG